MNRPAKPPHKPERWGAGFTGWLQFELPRAERERLQEETWRRNREEAERQKREEQKEGKRG